MTQRPNDPRRHPPALRALLAVALFGLSAPAYSLPTPDVIFSLINLTGITAAASATAVGSLYLLLPGIFGRRSDFVAGLGIGVLIALVVATGFLGYGWTKKRREARIRLLSVYLRCDYDIHEHLSVRKELEKGSAASSWQPFGSFRRIGMDEVAERLEQQPDAALIAANRLVIEYDSGLPAVLVGRTLMPFEHVRRGDLAAHLDSLDVADVYLTGFGPYLYPSSLLPEVRAKFNKFVNVYLVGGIKDEDLYVRQGERLHQADGETGVVDWPVEPEDIFDEGQIAFPEMTTLLTDEELAGYLEDDETFLVAPYDGSYRSRRAYEQIYLGRLFVDKDPAKIRIVDLNGPGVGDTLDEIATVLDGRPFAIVGISKYDWTDQGADMGYALWKRLGRDPERFRLLGFGPRLPEAAARIYAARTEIGSLDLVAGAFWFFVGQLQRTTGLSVGAAVLVLAVLLRLVLFPIGVRESRSRMLRALVNRRVEGDPRPVWSGSAAALLKKLGGGVRWEVVGALLTLCLIVPAYRVLMGESSPLLDQGFLWIDDLGRPDFFAPLLVGLLVLAKYRLAPAIKSPMLAAAIASLFALLLVGIPAGVLVWAFGVLLVTTLQDVVAHLRSEGALRRALLETV